MQGWLEQAFKTIWPLLTVSDTQWDYSCEAVCMVLCKGSDYRSGSQESVPYAREQFGHLFVFFVFVHAWSETHPHFSHAKNVYRRCWGSVHFYFITPNSLEVLCIDPHLLHILGGGYDF